MRTASDPVVIARTTCIGQYYELPQEEFFGPGMDRLESNRTNYHLDAIESGVAVRWRPSRFEFGGDVAYVRPRPGC